MLIHTQTRLLEVRLIVTSPLSSHFHSHLLPCFPPRAPFTFLPYVMSSLPSPFPFVICLDLISLSLSFFLFFLFFILHSAPCGHISRLTGARLPADALCGTKTRIFLLNENRRREYHEIKTAGRMLEIKTQRMTHEGEE